MVKLTGKAMPQTQLPLEDTLQVFAEEIQSTLAKVQSKQNRIDNLQIELNNQESNFKQELEAVVLR